MGCPPPSKSQHNTICNSEKDHNKQVEQVRYVMRCSIAHLKRQKVLKTGCKLSRQHTLEVINVLRKFFSCALP